LADFLTFAVVAPLGSMGGVAVGERRTGWDRPGRSAMLGLLAACLGVTRAEAAAQAELAAGLGLALRREGPAGMLLTDYHTAQVQASRRKRRFATRRDELALPGAETILSWRDYRTDCAFTAAVWRHPSASLRWSLEALADALCAPRFVPYLGRKSCPLGLPLAPRIVAADSIVAAFVRRDREITQAMRERGCENLERRRLEGLGGTIWSDPPLSDDPPLGVSRSTHTEQRRDAPLDRRRWQFALRDEVAFPWHAPQEEA
jgi:CRISPR system Cascade subunit CasD